MVPCADQRSCDNSERFNGLFENSRTDSLFFNASSIEVPLRSLGLGSCWVGSFDEDALERVLKIPTELKTHAIIPIGYAAEKPRPPQRLELKSIIFFEEFGNTQKFEPRALRSSFISR